MGAVQWSFAGETFQWRGPAPYVFVETSAEADAFLHDNLHLSYGWGCFAATVQVGDTVETTSLMPKDDVYLVPLKVRLRRAEGIEVGDLVEIRLTIET